MLTQFGVGPAARRAECIESSANTSVRGLFDKVKPVPVGRKRALIKGSVPRLLQRRNCELFNHSIRLHFNSWVERRTTGCNVGAEQRVAASGSSGGDKSNRHGPKSRYRQAEDDDETGQWKEDDTEGG